MPICVNLVEFASIEWGAFKWPKGQRDWNLVGLVRNLQSNCHVPKTCFCLCMVGFRGLVSATQDHPFRMGLVGYKGKESIRIERVGAFQISKCLNCPSTTANQPSPKSQVPSTHFFSPFTNSLPSSDRRYLHTQLDNTTNFFNNIIIYP